MDFLGTSVSFLNAITTENFTFNKLYLGFGYPCERKQFLYCLTYLCSNPLFLFFCLTYLCRYLFFFFSVCKFYRQLPLFYSYKIKVPSSWSTAKNLLAFSISSVDKQTENVYSLICVCKSSTNTSRN